MFVGHYGPAFALKRWAPRTPLIALLVAVQLVDVAWGLLVATGIEELRITPGITESNALDLIHVPYTHSLVAALIWSLAAGLVAALALSSRRAALAIAIAVASHWFLDFLVHRPDLPLLDDTHRVGLGLWNHRWVAFALELATLFAGLALYVTATRSRDRIGQRGPWLFAASLIGMQLFQIFGAPPPTPLATAAAALASYLAIALAASWIDRHRTFATA